jgi:hypothetical protein
MSKSIVRTYNSRNIRITNEVRPNVEHKIPDLVSHFPIEVSHIEKEVPTKRFRDKFHLHSFHSFDIIKVEEMPPEPIMMA